MLRLTFSSKLDWGSYSISIAKTVCKKIGALIRSMKFLSPEVALYFLTSMYGILLYVWAGASGCYLELLDNIQNEYAGMLVLHLLVLLNPWLFVEMFPG